MFRLPVKSRMIHKNAWTRLKSSSSFIRSTFIEYFTEKHGHKHIKSSSVVPLCDPTVPFVNAGMNQFKGVFLGNVDAPCPRAVNSQKCVRVGGKHNDLEMVGADGHHHTFFEMLGNWSFGDYYKKEACQMAWDLLLGPYRLKPENLVVTYFSGDIILGLLEDRECRDIWKQIGVPSSRLKEMGAADNFWEMAAAGPCGPCTEIHHVNPDGTLTEIWNIVFIQCNRQVDGKVKALRHHHVDTGMGLERMAALLQGVPTNYDTDLFQPIIKAIENNSKGVPGYGGRFGNDASLDCAYRRLADHARMVSVCLADGVFPATSVNLKQIMRKSFKISTEIFQNPNLLSHLYDEVVISLGSTYPELIHKEKEAKLIIEQEMEAYKKLRSSLMRKWKDLAKQHPEVEGLRDVETAGFAQGYKEFKEAMSKQKSTVIPGELVFKLYDTHGFQEDTIERIAQLNNLEIDIEGFWTLLSQHKSRHKTAFKEQINNKGIMFEKVIEKLTKNGVSSTNDQPKYNYEIVDNKIAFKPLKTKLVAILNEDGEWIDFLEPSVIKNYYLVTKETNFYCEEGGQVADTGKIEISKDITLKVDSVFKIRNFVFHKGTFTVNNDECEYVNCESEVKLEIDSDRRLKIMKNHTAVHLLNATIRQVLPNSVVCQIGSSVTDMGLSLNLSVYGEKLSHKVLLEAQELIRKSIKSNAQIETRVIDSIQLSGESSVLTVPGETYPETGLRLVQAQTPVLTKELCCGTHVPSTGLIEEICVTLVKGAGSNTPVIHALTGHYAEQARELFCRAEKLQAVIDLADSDRRMSEITNIKSQLATLCGSSGAPYGEYADCLALLDKLQKRTDGDNQIELRSIAQREVSETLQAITEGRRFLVHFVRCSYLLPGSSVARVLRECAAVRERVPVMLVGCGGGFVSAACSLPPELVTETFTAERWMRCILPVFNAQLTPVEEGYSPLTHAQMTATKVSLITCEQLVQDAMRVAIKFAQSHVKEVLHTESGHRETKSG